ncbi:uncharacterized protein BT62DRAFT_1004783 [Guyanagaster necrorhizus]|uniref:Uncharacterized protein n=1 Tax=Guyanagaster necrorhizus TaxID=856835 RepID=A0A9P7VVA1_9AGAR|nr:uncharacterized protein BT62DRAFT_1004783 [Guyanagaster necrorhizus MCA 3950]KAG7447207.1 hypothetical protein BT62DRAFT_1004783 [Guyanagaster necrorhizus MCA 3950]
MATTVSRLSMAQETSLHKAALLARTKMVLYRVWEMSYSGIRTLTALVERRFILHECPLYEEQRGTLRNVSRTMYLPDILGTKEGITALSQFMETTGAFTRTGQLRNERLAPEPEEEGKWWEEDEGDTEDEHG